MKKRIMFRVLLLLFSAITLMVTVSVKASEAGSVSVNSVLGKSDSSADTVFYGMQQPVAEGEMSNTVLQDKHLEAPEKDAAVAVTEQNTEVPATETPATETALQEEYPKAGELDLFLLDWEKETDEVINHYLGMTEWNVIGMWLSGMEEEQLQRLLERDTILVQDTMIQEPEGECLQMKYYEYALRQYQSVPMKRASYPAKTSGYWTLKIIKQNADGTPAKTAIVTFKISGIDTSVPIKKRQSVTVAKSIKNNWCDIQWDKSEESFSTYRAEDEEVYTKARAYVSFVKPAGYKASVSYSLSSSFYKLYWDNKKTFGSESLFLEGGVLSSNRYAYPKNVTYNGVNTASLTQSEYKGRHQMCAIVNMYVNAGIGTTGEETKGNVVQTITLSPSAYHVNYQGNKSTGGSVAVQDCTYDVNYITQSNGFEREYTLTYNGNGGNPSVDAQTVKYDFQGWGLNQSSTVSYSPGATFKNLTAKDGATATMYAIWKANSIKLPTATRSGYTFAGWNIGGAGASYTPAGNVTAVAKWTPNTYKIAFRSFGEKIYEDVTATYDQSVTLPTPVKPGYTFNGWKSASGIHIGNVKNLTQENGATVTLVADWSAETGTPYTVRCYKQPSLQVTDKSKYVLFSLKNKDPMDGQYIQYGTTDATISVSAPDVEGYETPSAQTIQILGDGSSIVSFYYNIATESTSVPGLSATDKQLDEIAKRIAAGLSFSLDVDGVSYEIAQMQDGTLGIKFISANTEKITIPDVVDIGGKIYRITEIQAEAFKGNKKIKQVQLSANISKIGDSAFEGCTDLKEITLRDGLVTIGNKAFKGCRSLKKIKLPDTVQSIGAQAFEGCSSMTKVTLNNGLLQIGKKAFAKCTALTKISIPKTVLKIDSYAFYKCSKMKKVSFASGSRLLSVGTGVFSECIRLEKIKLPSKLTAIPTKAFYQCKKLKSMTGGNAVTKIGKSALQGCKSLTKITLPSKVQTIGSKAFYGCKKLKKVTIKTKALTSVGAKAFKKCKKGIIFVVPKDKKGAYSKLFAGKY